MTVDTSERGLERLICTALTGHPCDPPNGGTVGEPPAGYGGVGWSGGNPHDYQGAEKRPRQVIFPSEFGQLPG